MLTMLGSRSAGSVGWAVHTVGAGKSGPLMQTQTATVITLVERLDEYDNDCTQCLTKHVPERIESMSLYDGSQGLAECPCAFDALLH